MSGASSKRCQTCAKARTVGGYLMGCRGAVLDPKSAGKDCADWKRRGSVRREVKP
jgi:hypothetical protein